MYLEKNVTVSELEEMQGRLSGLREHGEYITLTVVPMDTVWKVSADAKAIM
jgi:ADP-sugar diphosphatase